MAVNAGEPFVNAHVQRKWVHIVLDNAAGTVTIDATNTSPELINKCEVVTSATTGSIITEQTFTGANGTTIFGIGLLDGLAKGPVTGHAVFYDNTIANGCIGGMVAAIPTNGVTTSNNVAVKVTFVSTLAAKTGKAHVFLEYAA